MPSDARLECLPNTRCLADPFPILYLSNPFLTPLHECLPNYFFFPTPSCLKIRHRKDIGKASGSIPSEPIGTSKLQLLGVPRHPNIGKASERYYHKQKMPLHLEEWLNPAKCDPGFNVCRVEYSLKACCTWHGSCNYAMDVALLPSTFHGQIRRQAVLTICNTTCYPVVFFFARAFFVCMFNIALFAPLNTWQFRVLPRCLLVPPCWFYTSQPHAYLFFIYSN